MQQGFRKYSDMQQDYFLKSTSDIALNKRQTHATLAFLKGGGATKREGGGM